VAALAIAMVVAVAAVRLWPPAEPSYKAKPIRYWLQGYAYAGQVTPSTPPALWPTRSEEVDPAMRVFFQGAPASASGPTQAEADEAIGAMGADAVPALARILVERQRHLSPLEFRLLLMAQKIPFSRKIPLLNIQFYYPTHFQNHEAMIAFWKLGDKGAAASMELIREYPSRPASDSRHFIVRVLGYIGPKAKKAVPVLLDALTDESDFVRMDAACGLGRIHADPAKSVPALALCLSDGNYSVRVNAIWSLRQFGKDAKPAVPAILELLKNENFDPARATVSNQGIGSFPVEREPGARHIGRNAMPFEIAIAAAGALWEIDPTAAATAGLKHPQ
jgi:hypothetical protein